MDGFEANAGVIVLSATNRPDVCSMRRCFVRDASIARGDSPDLEGRRAILEVHAHDKPLAADVGLAAVARATPGFPGADLATA